MNILSVIDFNEIGYNMMVGVYGFLASVYNMLVDLTYETDFTRILGTEITNYTQPIYVLAGIFMLFRISISFLNYIVDPDKISDNQAGTSKILTRVVTSILLLLLLTPNGFVYDYLGRLQNAILKSGVLERITGQNLTISKQMYQDEEIILPIEEVDAATVTTCYYAYRTNDEIKGFYKMDVSSKRFSGSSKISNADIYTKFYTNIEKFVDTSSGKNLQASVSFKPVLGVSVGSYKKTTTCPQFLEVNSNDTSSVKLCKRNDMNCSMTTASQGWGGYESLQDMFKDIGNKNYNLQTSSYQVTDPNSQGVNEVIDQYEEDVPEEREKASTLGVQNEDAQKFTKAVGGSFLTCDEYLDTHDECEKTVREDIFTVKGDKKIIEYLKDNQKPLSFGFLPSIIIGLIVIIFVAILCVEVIVRSFKLLLFQITAPIPIMSYIDPKDKIFNEWLKMYLSTYADLFIKLIAINFGITFLNLALELELSGLQKIFYILAILVFIKTVPGIISKLFGIDIASGTFKDSMNMLKRGVGTAVGGAATLGAATAGAVMKFRATKGQSTGQRALALASGIGNAFTSTLRGAGAGSKGVGNGIKQAQSTFSQSWNKSQQYKDGMTEGEMIAGSMFGGALSYAATVDRENKADKDKMKTYGEFNKHKDNIESTGESSKFTKTLRQLVSSGQLKLNEDEIQDYRDTWIEYQIARDTIAKSQDFAIVQTQAQQTFDSAKSILEAQLNSGAITQTQFNNDVATLKTNYEATLDAEVTRQMNVDYGDLQTNINNKLAALSAQNVTNVKFEVEAGKQAGIVSEITKVNADLKGNPEINKAAKVNEVKSFKNVKDANTEVKHAATELDNKIYETEADVKYQASKAAMEAAKGNSGNK